MKHEESKLQRMCVAWFRMQYADKAYCLFAIPNGGRRDKITAAIMKGEGVLAGVADLFLMVPNNNHHGLWLEMKTPKGRQSDSQKLFEQNAKSQGYDYRIARTLDEFQFEINDYLCPNSKGNVVLHEHKYSGADRQRSEG
jgi:hypothetical protein